MGRINDQHEKIVNIVQTDWHEQSLKIDLIGGVLLQKETKFHGYFGDFLCQNSKNGNKYLLRCIILTSLETYKGKSSVGLRLEVLIDFIL